MARIRRTTSLGTLSALLLTLAACSPLLLANRVRRSDRGDVPGWVLITVMTAGLVSALWLFAGEALVNLFRDAIQGVTGPGTP